MRGPQLDRSWVQGTSPGRVEVCHVQVREVAKAAVGELYEALMGNDVLYKAWKVQNPGASSKELERRFIERNWGKCIQFARTTLGLMLTRDDISDKMKEEIMDVLEKDQSLRQIPHLG